MVATWGLGLQVGPLGLTWALRVRVGSLGFVLLWGLDLMVGLLELGLVLTCGIVLTRDLRAHLEPQGKGWPVGLMAVRSLETT